MTSSMSRIATSSPSTRCRRSLRLRSRYSVRRRTTPMRKLDVGAQQLLQAQRARLAVDQGDVVDAEGVLHRGELVELLEDGVGVEAVLDLEHQAQAVLAVGEVLDVGDALQLLGLHQGLDPLDDLLRADQVGQLGDHDAHPARGELLDAGRGAGAEAAAAVQVGVADAVEADDPAAAGQVGAGHELHQVVERAVRVGDQVPGRADHLDEVVRGHVGGHADRDAGGAVDQQVGVGGRQHARAGSASRRSSGRSRRCPRRGRPTMSSAAGAIRASV